MNKKLLFISALLGLCLISASSKAQVLFTESFSSSTLPAGWSNDSLGQPATNLWVFNNPYARVVTGAGFDANFAIFDSDQALTNDSIPELASLTTPSIDISTAANTLFLELDEQFRYYLGKAFRNIEYSTDTGTTWTTLVHDSLAYGYPSAVHSMYDLSALIGVDTAIIVRFTWTGDYDWWWAIDNVQIITYPPCVSPPVAGVSNASSASVCPDELFDLNVVGADIGIGITYQWQSSPDGSTWTNILAANTTTYSISQATATYYQCVVTCTGSSTPSVLVQVLMNPGTSCYCTPQGYSCVGLTGNIINVTVTGTTLNKNSDCDELTDVGYTFWPDLPSTSANLTRGTAYDFSVTTDDDNIISIWIDYDMNGGFEPTEWVQVCTTSTALSANTVNIMIPGSASMGPSRMRVRSRLAGNQNDAGSSCLLFGTGEAEDFVVGLDFAVGLNAIPLKGTSVYPNPGTGMSYIFFQNTVTEAKISAYDHIGRLVKSKNVSNVFSTNLDLSDESNGIYFIRIESTDGSITHKLILNK